VIVHTYGADKFLLGLGEPGDEVRIDVVPFRDGGHAILISVNGVKHARLNDVAFDNIKVVQHLDHRADDRLVVSASLGARPV